MLAHWLVKQEPAAYPFAQFVADKRTTWDGVRNAQARIHLRAMSKGDLVLYYHSGDERAVVGLAKVARAAFPDPTAIDGDWVAVDLVPVRALRPVSLATIKATRALAGIALVRQSRLSVMPIPPEAFDAILELAG